MSDVLTLKPSYYQALRQLTLELVGIRLGADHTFLIETRLATLARQEGFENLTQMIDQLFSRGETRLAIHVVSTLLERANGFFEDRAGLSRLTDTLIPNLSRAYKGRAIKILSFGCSSGQEVYSVAIATERIRDTYPDTLIDIVGVDYPSRALEQAKTGRYTHFEVQRGLAARDLITWFEREGENWHVKPELRARVSFIDHNLMADISDLGTYQIVLFRNRLGQFAPPAKIRILRMLGKIISADGYLLLGSKETLDSQMNFGFTPQEGVPGCFSKTPKPETGHGHVRGHGRGHENGRAQQKTA